MSLDWSFSMERGFRRCQRQAFFRNFAASHNARDSFRRECFLLTQLKSIDLWQGLLVHRGIELFVVPGLQGGHSIDWDRTTEATVTIAKQQLDFSRARRYREEKMSKTKAGDEYCALLCHEEGRDVTPAEWDETTGKIERAYKNLAAMDELWQIIRGRGKYFHEVPIHLKYDGANIAVRLDLLCFNAGKPVIIDWKLSESMGGSDARLQMGLYAWALCQSASWAVHRMEDVTLLEVQLLTPALVCHQVDEEAAVALENRIFRSLSEIRSLCGDRGYSELDVNDFALARNPNSCAFCPFKRPCQESLNAPSPVRSEPEQTELLLFA
jgi:PD-(D/E)XK nuclease superfamily